MSALSIQPTPQWRPTRGAVGMTLLIATESCFFAGFVLAYLFYIGKSTSGPQPVDVLDLPPVIVNSVALISSSVTIVVAIKALARGARGVFLGWLAATILLGGYFILGTASEWRKLMLEDGLWISTNLFGTTFYSLIGFHAFHVMVGLTLLTLVWLLGAGGKLRVTDAGRVEFLSWYWHFVDAVWVVVFITVYVVGR